MPAMTEFSSVFWIQPFYAYNQSQGSIPKVMTNTFQYLDGEIKSNYPAMTTYPLVIILIVSRFAEGKDKNFDVVT